MVAMGQRSGFCVQMPVRAAALSLGELIILEVVLAPLRHCDNRTAVAKLDGSCYKKSQVGCKLPL